MKRVDDGILDKLRTHLEKLPPRRNLRPADIIAELADSYSGTRARGYNLDDLVRVLEHYGIKLTRNTVRNYLSRARAERRKSRGNGTESLGEPEAEVGANAAPALATPPTAVEPIDRSHGVTSVVERARKQRSMRSDEDATQPGSFKLVADRKDL